VERVLDVLETVVVADGINLTEVGDHNGLTPTTALRYLRALEARGYVRRDDDGSYRPGAELQRIASRVRVVDPVELLVARLRSTIERLADVTGETTYLAVADGDVARYVDGAESTRAIRHAGGVGQVLPLDGTAVGAALREPGEPVVVRGAFEPDITAVSFAMSPDVAVSVVGPTHRMGDDEVATISRHLRGHLRTHVRADLRTGVRA
jgi:IclR family transcriptional regulator, acetate operon repressor